MHPIALDHLKCNFDSNDLCAWSNLRDDDFDWSVGQRTPSFGTGPSQDHTTKKGDLFPFRDPISFTQLFSYLWVNIGTLVIYIIIKLYYYCYY